MQTMKATQFKVGRLSNVVDRLGKPAKLADVSVASSDETVATASYDEDSGDVTVVAVAPGSARVVVTGDKSVDDGLQPFIAEETFTVQSGDVESATLTFGDAQEQ